MRRKINPLTGIWNVCDNESPIGVGRVRSRRKINEYRFQGVIIEKGENEI